MIDVRLEPAAGDLAATREKIRATREAMQLAIDAQCGDVDAIRTLIARFEQIEVGVTEVESVVREWTGRPTTRRLNPAWATRAT